LIDLAEKIISAESIPVSQDKIQHALGSSDRLAVSLKSQVPISIRYDTLVIQQGVLHVYPDIYNRGTNTVENLRTDLSAVGVNASGIDDRVLSQMIDRATKDVSSGDALSVGRDQPLTSQNAPLPSRGRTAGAGKAHHARRSRR
jgi:hypothetical protein